jgi:PAS domain S-box-containing protein
MSKEILKVLIIEDNEDDLALLLRELNKGNYEIYYEHTEDFESFESALKKKWDVIISDYSLPNFNGFEALLFCNKIGLETPFIMVSGTIGEDIAVEMMKAGAKDYIMKKSLKRLLPAIEREIEDAKIKAKNKLIVKEKEIIFEINQDILNTDSLDDLLKRIHLNIKKIIYAENCFIALHDLINDEIYFPFFVDMIDSRPGPRKKGKGFTEYVMKTGVPLIINSANAREIAKENKIKIEGTVSESWLAVPLISHSITIGVLVVSSYEKDIKYTVDEKNFLSGIANQIALAIERRQSEEALRDKEEKFRHISSTISDISYSCTRDVGGGYSISWITGAVEKIFGYSVEEILGMKCWGKLVIEEDMAIFEKHVSDLTPGQSDVCELKIKHKNDSIIWIQSFAECNQKAGDLGKEILYGGLVDITERKWSENTLRESEEHYRTLLNAIPDLMFRLDSHNRITDYHAEDLSILFAPPEKFIGKRYNEILPPDISKQLSLTIKEVKKTGEIKKFEYEAEVQKNQICYYEARVTCFGDECVAIIRDITERKKSEEALQISEERFQLATRAANDVIYDWNLQSKEGWFSESYSTLFGYDKTSAKFDKWIDIIHPDDRKTSLMLTDSVINGGSNSWETEYRLMRRDGSYAYVLDRGYVIRNKNGKPVRLIGSIIDFTERKKAEENLRASEEKYRSIFENVQDVFYQLNNEGIITEISPSVSKYSNYNREDLIGKSSDVFYLNLDDRDEFLNRLQQNGKVTDYEIKLNTGDGVVRDASVSAHLRFDKNNNPIGIEGSLRDITERKRIQEALKESEEQYRKLYELSPETIYVQCEGNIVFINPAGLKLFKAKNASEIIGRKVLDFIHPELKEIVSNRMSVINSEAVDLPAKEEKYLCLDGSTIDVEVIATPFLYQGKDGALVILRDISERKKSEEALKESEERYRILIETMHDGVMQVDNNDKIQFVNNSMCDMLGYTYHELVGKIGINTIIHKDDGEFVREKNRLRLKGISDIYEIRGVKKNGEIIWLNVSGTPVCNKNGKVIGSFGFVSDITERKHAEEEVLKISQAINQSPVTIVITDINGNIEYVNPKFVEITGYKPEEVIGKNPKVLKSGEKEPEEYKELWDTITSGKDWIGEFHNKKKNGELYWENASISPVKNQNGKITHFLAIKEDVTEKKQREMELVKAKEKAEESERLKSSFLANMSHELRTPMVGILGFAELLKDMTDNSELKDFSDNILRSGKRLLETLNLILDLSRIEAGKLELKTTVVDLIKLSREIYNSYAAEVAKKKLNMSFESTSDSILTKVDERMLWESINNIINNAIKYTKTGEIKIEIGNDGNKKAVIKVSDTGIGIPEQSIGIIFEEFRQVSEGYSRGFEGTGLGLTITKNFIEKIGGTISVESELGVGSIFKIELPLLESVITKAAEPEAIEEKIIIREDKSIHILCVDDDSFTREYLDYILKDFYLLSFADNGITAIYKAKSVKFNLILMDINLGKGMDGIEAARKIHKLPGYLNIPVIAMTAFAMKGDREEFLTSGMSDYISKPFKKNELIKIVNGVLKK